MTEIAQSAIAHRFELAAQHHRLRPRFPGVCKAALRTPVDHFEFSILEPYSGCEITAILRRTFFMMIKINYNR